MKKIIALFAIILALTYASSVHAVPANPDEIDIEQPDHTRFKARINGDEFQNWIEITASGHTIIKNTNSSYWEYAEKDTDGTLKASGVRVDPTGRRLPPSIQKGIRPERNKKMEQEHNKAFRDFYNQRLAPSPGSSRVDSIRKCTT